MSQADGNWKHTSEPKKPESHPHYPYNLSVAKSFIRNTQKELLEGMSVLLAEQDRLLMICWSPALEIKVGRYAAPINLHQDSKEVERETEFFFNSYMRMAKDCYKIISKPKPSIMVINEQDLF